MNKAVADLRPFYAKKKWLEREHKAPSSDETVLEVAPVINKKDKRPYAVRKFEEKRAAQLNEKDIATPELSVANSEEIANDIALKSDIMGRVLKGVAMNSRFKTANEPLKQVEFEQPEHGEETEIEDATNNVSIDPQAQEGTDVEDAMMHYPTGEERQVTTPEITIEGKNTIILTFDEAKDIVENIFKGIKIEWR